MAPPQPGERLELTVNDMAFGGEGVGRWGDWVVFVPFVIPGERVEVEIVEAKKKFGRARLVQVLAGSTHRVEPKCPYYGECGGCQYQHIDYAEQLRIKHKQVTDVFQRIGRIPESQIDPVMPCPRPYGYRNRIMVRSQWNRDSQALHVGYLRHDNRMVVDVESCAIAEPVLNEELQKVHRNPPPKGGLKVVLRKFPDDWEVPPDSFFQNNFLLLPGLVETVRDRVRDSGARYLIDAYCGVGFFGIELADLLEDFVGVELDQRAIRAARNNARQRDLSTGHFLNGDAESMMPELLQRFDPQQTAVVIDPPRKGCRPSILERLREKRLAQVIYVSCNPATLARDLGLLCRDGVYALKRVTPLDMFPQTQHVECVADLRIAGSS